MPNVDISINSRSYAVSCDEGQEQRVRDLASMIDSRVAQLTGGGAGAVGETHLLVLAGLMLADELNEAKARAETRSTEDTEVLVAAVDHLTDRIEAIAARLAAA